MGVFRGFWYLRGITAPFQNKNSLLRLWKHLMFTICNMLFFVYQTGSSLFLTRGRATRGYPTFLNSLDKLNNRHGKTRGECNAQPAAAHEDRAKLRPAKDPDRPLVMRFLRCGRRTLVHKCPRMLRSCRLSAQGGG